MSAQERYKLTPQMQEYDRAGRVWVPHLMYFQEPDYRSDVMNTDSRGFRLVKKGGKPLSDFGQVEAAPLGLLVGGSTAFGVGATCDGATIPSLLNQGSGYTWLNFGGRAFSSTQELLLFLFYTPMLKELKKVVLLSGINNLLLFYLSKEYSRDFGSFFSATQFGQLLAGAPAQPAPSQGLLDSLQRLIGKSAAPPVSAPARGLLKPILDHDAQLADLLQGFDRDLYNWTLFSKALGFEIHYALQPLYNWVRKKPAPQETVLFDSLDAEQGERWRAILSEKLGSAQHPWLASNLHRICTKYGIPFTDLNDTLSSAAADGEWLFVDRVHLTDAGYRLVADSLRQVFSLR